MAAMLEVMADWTALVMRPPRATRPPAGLGLGLVDVVVPVLVASAVVVVVAVAVDILEVYDISHSLEQHQLSGTITHLMAWVTF
jgi:hypothetical protein